MQARQQNFDSYVNKPMKASASVLQMEKFRGIQTERSESGDREGQLPKLNRYNVRALEAISHRDLDRPAEQQSKAYSMMSERKSVSSSVQKNLNALLDNFAAQRDKDQPSPPRFKSIDGAARKIAAINFLKRPTGGQ